MEYCCHAGDSAPNCYVDMQDKLQRRGHGGAAPTLAASFEPLARCRNVVSLNLFRSYYFGGWLSELDEEVLAPSPCGRPTHERLRC